MSFRPRDLTDRLASRHPPKILTLPVEAARHQARRILNSPPQGGYATVVENWRQLPDGNIEFTLRRLPTAE
jgi:hypothetical protein